MVRFFEIVWSSFKMALEEFRSNKLRTFLSLFGITVGIFCIIGVLATVDSLGKNVQNDIGKLGSKTIYVDKWDYSGRVDRWKQAARPAPVYTEAAMIKQRSDLTTNVAFNIRGNAKVEWGDEAVSDVNLYGVTEDFSHIQQIDIQLGRYFQQSDFDYGSGNAVIGFNVAEKLFGKPEKAVGEEIDIKGHKARVIGLITKQGKSMMDAWEYDECVLLTYGFMKGLVKERYASPVLIVQGRPDVPMALLRDDVQGAMRSIRKLRPSEPDNFTLNDIEAFGKMMEGIFSGVNMGGWAIAILSLVVGMFGVANIMFVTVRERTPQIGLKKAIGAKRSYIMTEFLLESAFLCIMGGMIGLILVFVLTRIFSNLFGFPIFISPGILILAISICIITGVLAGIIPAFKAAKMDPVVAIRSK
ncbi:MAG: ABC transporter permease [Bacteroidetes bacterium]|nr:ABC transporter permease [Bacteroidota bacterium]